MFANRLRRVVVKNLRVSKLVRAPSRRERLSRRFSLVFHGLFVDQSLILTSVDPKRRCRPSSDLDHPNIACSNCPITRIKYVCVIVGAVILGVVKFASVSLWWKGHAPSRYFESFENKSAWNKNACSKSQMRESKIEGYFIFISFSVQIFDIA